MSWKSEIEYGWKKPGEYWARWASPDGLYFWLHPVTKKWVGEPDQIDMPTFAYQRETYVAVQAAEPPPGAI